MDFITHALVGAGAALLLSPRREWIPQLTLAAVVASELQDADFWLYLIHPSYYGKYHRVASHNLWGLALVGLSCAALAWAVACVRPWRRFGWFVSDNLARDDHPAGDDFPRRAFTRLDDTLSGPAAPDRFANPVSRAPFRLFVLVGLVAAYLHFLGDVITGFGNILPFWPWSQYDASLHAVNSFDTVIFSATLGWHIALRWFKPPRRRAALLTACYAAAMVVYVLARIRWGEPTVW